MEKFVLNDEYIKRNLKGDRLYITQEKFEKNIFCLELIEKYEIGKFVFSDCEISNVDFSDLDIDLEFIDCDITWCDFINIGSIKMLDSKCRNSNIARGVKYFGIDSCVMSYCCFFKNKDIIVDVNNSMFRYCNFSIDVLLIKNYENVYSKCHFYYNEVMMVGNCGSSKRDVYYLVDKNIVWCGCFDGDLAQFEKDVKERYFDISMKGAKNYYLAIEMFKKSREMYLEEHKND
ncbi:MAG: hypothetical protein ACRC28_18825 [Clostridium sp.]|uniref:hypothetical protein n=1 Tax=Clostridium sp. TaxID=1506 RepID=UPI003F3118F7